MRLKAACLFCVLAVLAITASAVAQEGHPLTGTWYGDFGMTSTQRNDITVIMSWNGKVVSGIINPGPDVVHIAVATLDSSKWTVHLEADAKDSKGNKVRFVADGKLDQVTSYNRTLAGTWTCGATKGDFKIRRD